MPFSLFDDLKLSGFHSSILTTYSVDPAFYDANIQYRLRSFGCQNNLLVADASMLEQALEQLPEAFVHAGRKYLIVPISSRACFHPKLNMRYGKSKARLTLGSANATSAGWGSNRELIGTLKWSENDEHPDNDAQLNLFTKTHDWLVGRLPAQKNPDLAYKLDLLAMQSPWLADAPRSEGPQTLADDSLFDVLLSDADSDAGLADQLIAQVDDAVQRLVVISPYWDSELSALRQLHSAFDGPPIHIFLTLSDDAAARQSTFPTKALDNELKPKFHPLGGSRHRFLHAKLIMVQTRHHDFVLFGSANCTTGALGTPDRAGVNGEAVVFRRLPRGTIDHELALDYSVKIRVRDIAEPEQEELKPKAIGSFEPGRIERKGKRLLWSCPDGVPASGAAFVISGTRLSVETPAGARPYVQIDAGQTASTIIVRVALADGRLSRAVIVSDPEMLMAAAPNPFAGNLKRKLDAILSGESDLIDLARDVHLLFEDRGGRGPSGQTSGGRGRQSASSKAAGQDYDSPEEFRAALGLKADLYSGMISHADNPALQLVLQIVLRGIVNLQTSSSIDQSDNEADRDLAAGEDQDDVGAGDGRDDDEAGNNPRTISYRAISEMGPTAPISTDQLDRNRSSLNRAIERFEEYVDDLSSSRTQPDLDFVTRTLVMLYLMLYGCSRLYTMEDGTTEVLIPFSDIGTTKGDDGFLKRAARLLLRIWGHRFKDGLMARLAADSEDGVLPLPIMTLVILSRWILGAILSEARASPKAKPLAGILEKQVPNMFRATSAFVSMDSDQVAPVIEQMAKHIGMASLRAEAIQNTVTELSALPT